MGRLGEFLDGEALLEVWGEIAPETRAFIDSLGMKCKYVTRKAGFTGMLLPRTL